VSVNRKFVGDFHERDRVLEVFLCTRKSLHVDRNGKKFLSLVLADRTGEVEALLWDNAEELSATFDSSDLLEVTGVVVSYQGRMQIHLSALRRIDPAGVALDAFYAVSSHNPETMWKELLALLGSLGDPHLSTLAQVYLDDPVVSKMLKVAPAAKSIHHACIGGLLEHTLSVMQLTERICQHYATAIPGLLNRDLCLIGAFLHDLGKLWEISSDWGFQYTDQGRLLGHLVLGLEVLDQKLVAIEGIPRPLADHLRHLIIAHHGKREHGSPEPPKTAEAIVVHRADEIDGRLGSLRDIFAQNPPGWTSFQPLYSQQFFHGYPCGEVSAAAPVEPPHAQSPDRAAQGR
jgi:3'-5' exoribonuclease